MARKATVLTTADFEFSGIVVTKKGRGKAATLKYVDRDGKEIDRATAKRREYSSAYRANNSEASKESSRRYAARVRLEAKAWRDANESDDHDEDPK